MDKIGRISLLLDFYGPLLTEKQREYMGLYYNDDLSLGEIALENSISRQAVYDNVKRGEKLLEDYENKLGLVGKFLAEREKLNKVADIVKDYKKQNSKESLDQVLKLLSEIIELEAY